MLRPYDPYIPQTIGELIDQLGSMTGSAPTFVDKLGDSPGPSTANSLYSKRASRPCGRKSERSAMSNVWRWQAGCARCSKRTQKTRTGKARPGGS